MVRCCFCASLFVGITTAFVATPRPLLLPAPPSVCAIRAAVELPSSDTKLDDFLQLLGRSYAVAGLAHAADFATGNTLPTAAGLPPFVEIGPLGQAMGVFWCFLGLVQPLAAERAPRRALAIAYGVYEIVLTLGAGIVTTDPDGTPMRLAAAAAVQALVAFCYYELLQSMIEVSSDPSPKATRRGSPMMKAGRKSSEPEKSRSFQQVLEDSLGKGLFKSLVILTGVLCYPLMLYGVAMKNAVPPG